LNDGLTTINQLQPKTFDFLTGQYPSMNLQSGNHPRLIAQDLEQVLPGLVFPVTHPATYDAKGNVLIQQLIIKALTILKLYPILLQQ